MLVYATVGILALGALCALAVFLKKRKQRGSTSPRIYSGPIRITSRDGRNLRIVPKENGSFAMEEEGHKPDNPSRS